LPKVSAIVAHTFGKVNYLKTRTKMNTIVLKNSIDYHQYQQIVDFFATIGVEIENPYGEVTLQDDEVLLQALDEGITQADNGLLIPHNEVMQEIDLLLTTM
jgi:hypothetical protein